MNIRCIPSRITTTAAALVTTFLGGSIVLAVPADDVKTAASSAPAAKVAAEHPSAESILKRSIEVTGGEKLHRDLKSRVTTAKLSIAAMGIEGKLTMHQEAPNRIATIVALGGLGDQRQVFNGEFGWEISSMAGPRLLTEAEVATLRMQGAIDAALTPEKHYESMKTTDRTEFAGEAAYEVTLKIKDGPEMRQYFSVESGRMIGSLSTMATQMGDIETRTTMSDYREVDGFTIPHRMQLELPAMGMTQLVTIERVEHNVEIDASIFAVPQDIERMRERAAAPATEG